MLYTLRMSKCKKCGRHIKHKYAEQTGMCHRCYEKSKKTTWQRIIDLVKLPPQWERIDDDDIPRWVEKAARNFEQSFANKPYDATKHFKGNTYVYKVSFPMIEQGQYARIFYRKLKKT